MEVRFFVLTIVVFFKNIDKKTIYVIIDILTPFKNILKPKGEPNHDRIFRRTLPAMSKLYP